MTHYFRKTTTKEVDPRGVLGTSTTCAKRSGSCAIEVVELRASRARLVLAADADRSGSSVPPRGRAAAPRRARGEPPACGPVRGHRPRCGTRALLEEMGREVQHALDETVRLAQRIYPPLLEAGGLVVALRAAAGAPVSPFR